jgi:hypothetical protein
MPVEAWDSVMRLNLRGTRHHCNLILYPAHAILPDCCATRCGHHGERMRPPRSDSES